MAASDVNGDGEKIVVLSTDEEYRVEISATDNGTVTYFVTENDLKTNETTRLVSYENVKIATGDNFNR